ncbi:hypothetical protein DO97_04100 [Neosynechococcus sphagnicola sy1]|uniref:Uncharacterized protein n=1 Tax=Neosynechococcus sphagnicola sy1 TaxID=1497020 RepID=A0A098TKT0_9CYAN|nr:hypothetical protein [Neosynechococcus sphagnicola]KGF72891.1 hypothetical protein DO97_04100 [Neosynechococcus sphagnicola sy1]
MIYALVRISQLIDEFSLQQEAHLVISLFTPELILADRNFDVLGGIAGKILGLLTLWEAVPTSPALEVAITCGERLLRHQ